MRTPGAPLPIAIAAALLLVGAGCSSGSRGLAPASPSATVSAPSTPAFMPSPPEPIPSVSTAAEGVPTAALPLASATVVYHGDTSRRMVALTFDAGADAGYTGEILDTLRHEGVRATFGITGLWAEGNRDLLLAITADGHALTNHSYNHASFTGLSTEKPPLTADERALELSRTETSVYYLSQRTTRPYFRPPFGDLDASVERDAGAAGYSTIVMWTVDSQGWNHASADQIVARCLAQASPGAIYVMHVGSESQDAAALPRVITGLRDAGYSFGTIDEVLE
ncbi:MAG: polysaccharide deacetylase family protein [Chloroflexota bacterium]|nr:polysaccharide deacetylase family protein [Chloroflexota bacterium]